MPLDFHKLGEVAGKHNSLKRAINASRIVQFDADFACYEVADLEKPLEENTKALVDYLEMKRTLFGAGAINAFVTLKGKSGRESMATVKPYQENRDPNVPIKVRVRELRHWLTSLFHPTITVIASSVLEADDAMCMHQNNHIANGNIENSILVSGDKDLWMVEGWHGCPKTGRKWLVDGYGFTEYREVGNVKPKLVGEGTSWFWHQMIMGDRADNIPGLERIDNKFWDKYEPLKSRKPRKDGNTACGEAKAVRLLRDCKNDKQAGNTVYAAYTAFYGTSARFYFMENAYLLWMQRTLNPFDVEVFFKEVGLPFGKFTKQQVKKLKEYNEVFHTN